MRIPPGMRDELVAHALEEAPNECCGMVAGSDDGHEHLLAVRRCTNEAESMTRYEISGPEQMDVMADIEENGWELRAIYHSHTVSPPEPSEMDVASAFYPDVLYLIVGVQDPDWPEVRGFWIRDGKVSEEPLEIS